MKPFDIFLSYSHADEDLMNLVRKQLVIYDRQKKIRKWWDRKILPGTQLNDAILYQLQNSDVILLFISADFFDSDYCYEIEMTQALQQHTEGKSVVIPVILRPCGWKSAPFKDCLALPEDGIPLTKWSDQDEAAKSIADGVMRIVEELHKKRAAIKTT